MHELNSKGARVGQFEQFVHVQAVTKEIAAIKNCEIYCWNFWKIISPKLFYIIKRKFSQITEIVTLL